jgi:hypothetical protein
MQYGICSLSIVPVHREANYHAPLASQLLYGEWFKILEHRKHWSRIRASFDGFEGWIQNLHYAEISETQYSELDTKENHSYSRDLVSFVKTENESLMPILMGSEISNAPLLGHIADPVLPLEDITLVNTALLYVNAPYLRGGKSPFGIDSAGLSQMVYKINGVPLKRTAIEQAKQGIALSFIEESDPGDLAFFDNKEGEINHVGIILQDNYIVHSHGKVRIDRIDHTGIFNSQTKHYTHSLRVIKKMIP